MDKRVKFSKDINKAFRDYFSDKYSSDILDAVLKTYDWESWLLLGGCGLDLFKHLEAVEKALHNR